MTQEEYNAEMAERQRLIDECNSLIAQINYEIERQAELQAELARLLIKQGDVKKTTSEIADVLIMVNQLTIILDITPEELENWIKFKIDRQLERIKEQEQAGADCGWRKP